MAVLLSWRALIQRFPFLYDGRATISCMALRGREERMWKGRLVPENPRNPAHLYCKERYRQNTGPDASPFIMCEVYKEWSTLSDTQKKPFVEHWRQMSQEYKKFKESLSKIEHAEYLAWEKECRLKAQKKQLDIAHWREDKQKKADFPRRWSGPGIFMRENFPSVRMDHSTPQEAIKAIAKLWNELDEDMKARYYELARVRYKDDMKAYLEAHPDFVPLADIPKRLTGHKLFFKERLSEARMSCSGDAKQAMRIVNHEWSSLSMEEKAEYKEKAGAQFEKAVLEFMKTHPTYVPLRYNAPKKKQGFSVFASEAFQGDQHATSPDEVLVSSTKTTKKEKRIQWNQLSKHEKWYYKVLAENEYNRKLKVFLYASGIQQH